MSVELQTDNGAARPVGALEAVLGAEPLDGRRPNVSGDLPSVLQAAPMFRRAVAGYDRFQVDTYVRWAEDELATAERERARLEVRHLRTQAALEEAEGLLAHSSGGGEFLRLSRRIGSMLAAAADEAEGMRAEAEADRSAASALLERAGVRAEGLLADARTEAERTLGEAATAAGRMAAEADRIAAEAEETRRQARVEAHARLERVRAIEQRAAEQVEQLRRQSLEAVSAARLQARDEVVRMLGTGREERRRADAAAAATRERLDRAAAARYASLVAEVEALEHRRSALRAEVELLAGRVAATTDGRMHVQRRRLSQRLQWRPRTLRAP